DSLYSIPPTNPFLGDTTFYPELWAIGMRNPWRWSFDRLTHDTWIGDVGQSHHEEVDFIQYPDTGGENYGWDCYEGLFDYEPANCDSNDVVTWPIYDYPHDGYDCTVIGGYVYRGAQYGNMYGRYIFCDYCSGRFRSITRNNDGTFTVDTIGDELITGDEYVF